VLDFLKAYVFHPADFVIRADAFAGSDMARMIVAMVSTQKVCGGDDGHRRQPVIADRWL
jgi:hypothetical protein